jgi:hypothetical protein
LEEFALRFLVSGMWGFNPDEGHVKAVLRSISWTYVCYIAVILIASAFFVWMIRKTQNRYARTALITFFYLGFLFSPLLFYTFEDAFRPPKAPMEVYVHLKQLPILAVTTIAMAASTLALWLRPSQKSKGIENIAI